MNARKHGIRPFLNPVKTIKVVTNKILSFMSFFIAQNNQETTFEISL